MSFFAPFLYVLRIFALNQFPCMVEFELDGRRVTAPAGISVAAAVMNAGVERFRDSVRGEPRGSLCGMGSCHECRLSIDGRAQLRACMVTVREGMRVVTGG